MKPIEDALHALLLAALAGDNAAYSAFLTQASGRLRAYFRRRMSAWPDDVEDLVQETLIALHNQRHTYRPTQPLTAWMHAIARYKMIDSLRARSTRESVVAPFDIDEVDETLAAIEPLAGQARRDVGRLLDGLPDRFRLPIQHVKLEGMSIAETALHTGMSESAVKIGIHRGLKVLAERVRKTS